MDVFCSTLWNLVKYKILFPVAINCCKLTIRYYIGYGFNEILLIKLTIVEYNYGCCKKCCWLYQLLISLLIFCKVLLTKLIVAEYCPFFTVTTRFSVKVFSNRTIQLLLTTSCILEYQLLLLHKIFLKLTVIP